ncbi:MAG: M20/M25/M40 family metallo-hydrolase [Pyrinomonadaceae bacterium]
MFLLKAVVLSSLLFALSGAALPQNTVAKKGKNSSPIEQRNVRAQMEFLASDAMQGRGSGTLFEWIAGQYFGSQMRQFGIEPAGEKDAAGNPTYIQTVSIVRNSFAEAPKLTYSNGEAAVSLEHGKSMVVFRINTGNVSGPLQKISVGEKPKPGAVVYAQKKEGDDEAKFAELVSGLFGSDAAAVLIEATEDTARNWNRFGSRNPSFSSISGNTDNAPAFIILDKESAEALGAVGDGTKIEIGGKLDKPEVRKTWNAVGMIKGTDSKLMSEAIVLSAHMDHLGVRDNAPGDDKIFNGADDDASGCVAVIELARVLAVGKKPKRTVYFVFFGSEEAGGYGARYFVSTLPFPKEKLVTNLQFEMIGRPDEKVAANELWLTGYDRSNLGPELAKQGALLVNDPHPEQNFFQRSDNYTLARQGIIAHTVSSFGLHKDYHQASDEIETIDFEHMTRSINSMVKPIEWLINSNFVPSWYEGKRP